MIASHPLLVPLPVQLLPRSLLQQRAQVLHAVLVGLLLLPAHVEPAADRCAEFGICDDLFPLVVFGIVDLSLERGVPRDGAVLAVALVSEPGVGGVVTASNRHVIAIFFGRRLLSQLRERRV